MPKSKSGSYRGPQLVLDRPVAVNKQLNRRLSAGLLGLSAATIAVALIYAIAAVVGRPA